MTAGIETRTIDTWIAQTCKGDSVLASLVGGRVYDAATPQEQMVYPYIIFQYMSGTPDQPAGGVPAVGLDATYQVQAVGVTEDYDDLAPIVARVHALLNQQTGTVPGLGSIFTCTHVMPIKYPDPEEGGVQKRHLGNTYRIKGS